MHISDWSSDVCSSDLLAEGRFFFLDVVKDGIALYQSDDSELATPKPKRPADALMLAREYYEEWFPSAGAFYKMFELALAEGTSQIFLKNAAFQLHQTTERLYHTLDRKSTRLNPST